MINTKTQATDRRKGFRGYSSSRMEVHQWPRRRQQVAGMTAGTGSWESSRLNHNGEHGADRVKRKKKTVNTQSSPKVTSFLQQGCSSWASPNSATNWDQFSNIWAYGGHCSHELLCYGFLFNTTTSLSPSALPSPVLNTHTVDCLVVE